MIDASIDRDYAAFERRQGEAAVIRDVPRRRTSGTLAELPARPPTEAAAAPTEAASAPSAVAESVELSPPPPPRTDDTHLSHLRMARFGLVAVILLLAALAMIRHWRSRR